MITLICICTFISTLAGGLFALKFSDKLYLVLGFSAGAVIGITFFDLLPTALSLTGKYYSINTVTGIVGLGFIIYLAIDRLVIMVSKAENTKNNSGNMRGKIVAFFLTMHSFVDGTIIGLAFQVSLFTGGVVTTAVLVHDFADGINIINVILKEKGNKKYALRWLIVNAIAPLLGAYSTFYYHLPSQHLGLLLALIAGFFLYIGAGDFLPDSFHRNPKFQTLLMTLLGFATIYLAIRGSGNL